jgi:alkylated DNA repair dioxygenase AlkB
MIHESCQVCKCFFPSFDSDDSVSQVKKPRSNVRSLSKSFASSMEKFGKTKVIEDSLSTRDSASDVKAQQFPAKDIIERYYTHDKPELFDRKTHEEWVITQIERWRAVESQGEASEAVYTGLFRYQSGNGLILHHDTSKPSEKQ